MNNPSQMTPEEENPIESADSGSPLPQAISPGSPALQNEADWEDSEQQIPAWTGYSQTPETADGAAAQTPSPSHAETTLGPQIVFDPTLGRPNAALKKLAKRTARLGRAEREAREEADMDGSDMQPARPKRIMARSEATENQYRVRVRTAYKYSYSLRTFDPQNPIEPSPMEVVQDLIDSSLPDKPGNKPRLSPASWSLYRSALLWHLAERRHLHKTFDDAYTALAEMKAPNGVKLKPRSRKKATFLGNDFNTLINQLGTLNTKSSSWGSAAAYWIQAGIVTGARVSEWAQARWLDRDKLMLLIPTIKRKESKPAFHKMKINSESSAKSVHDLTDSSFASSGQWDEPSDEADEAADSDETMMDGRPYRVIHINREDAIFVDMHLLAIYQNARQKAAEGIDEDEAFFRYYKMTALTLRKACDIAFRGDRYYTLRHTRSHFAAIMKTTNPIGVVAAMMGHTSTRTTMGSYGSRLAGLRSKGQLYIMADGIRQGAASAGEPSDAFSDAWLAEVGGSAPAATPGA